MRTFRKLFLAGFFSILLGCALGPPKENDLNSTVYGFKNASLVVGTLENGGGFSGGEYIGFKNINTGNIYGYNGAKDIEIWLPEGLYEVEGLGAIPGAIGPYGDPLEFFVKPGMVLYIGTLSYGCARRSEVMKEYGVKNCGVLALNKTCTVARPYAPMCILDDSESFFKKFREKRPQFSAAQTEKSLMK